MDRLITVSFFSFDNLYGRYPWLEVLAVNDLQFLTMAWNILLALAPLGFYFLLKRYWLASGLIKLRQKAVAAALFIFWLIFFPNTAYMITDVRHLINFCPADSLFGVCPANAWMIIFFFVYGFIGWLAFYYNLKFMSGLVGEIFKKFWANVFIALTVPLTALGVLLGLLNRFNSWDIFYPKMLLQAVWFYFSSPDYFIDWYLFTIFLYLLYFAGEVIFKYELFKNQQSR